MQSVWAQREFSGIGLWDRRCVSSVIRIARSLSDNAGAAFSTACGDSLRQSGSAIFSHEDVDVEQLQSTHYRQTALRSREYERVVVAQDTSYLDFSSHRATTGLGPIGTRGECQGLVMHS